MLAKYNHKPWKYIKCNGLFWKNPNRKGGGAEDILFWKCLWNFLFFFTLSLEVPGKTKFSPCIFHKVVLDPLEIPQGQKQRLLEITHYFFLVTLGNSTSFLINPWKFHSMWLFLWYPWKFHILNPSSPLLKGGGGGNTFQKLSHLGGGGGTKNFARKGG